MNIFHETHVLTKSEILLFQKSILLLKFYVAIKKFFGLLVISWLGKYGLPFWYDTFVNTWFFSYFQSICSDNFTGPLWWCLAHISACIRVSTRIKNAFSSIGHQIIIQKIWVVVIIQIASLFLIVIHDINWLYISDIIKDKLFLWTTALSIYSSSIHYFIIISHCLNFFAKPLLSKNLFKTQKYIVSNFGYTSNY